MLIPIRKGNATTGSLPVEFQPGMFQKNLTHGKNPLVALRNLFYINNTPNIINVAYCL